MKSHHLTLSDARAMASGWHFAKECLSAEEHRMLWIIEELLAEIDGDGFAHVWPSEPSDRRP